MNAAPTLAAGFADPGRDSQTMFRAILDAMARPGRVLRLERLPPASPGLGAAAAAVLLTLADADTPVWTDAGEAADWLRFHAGCPLTAEPQDAMFVHAGRAPPPLSLLEAGTEAAPQRAATLVVEVAGLRDDAGWRLRGPGIEDEVRLAVDGLPDRFLGELAANHARYPAGVDVILCAGDRIAALPRSTQVVAH